MEDTKCLYCNKNTINPHLTSDCCGKGMCDECYDGLQGTEEQIQVDYWDIEEEEMEVLKFKGWEHADYLCFECFAKAQEEYKNFKK